MNQGAAVLGISLYRQYRPQKFSEVAGQSAVVDVIVKSLEHARVGHAYLFSGPRGCGKTTIARLLAKALNCLSPQNGYEPCCECKNCLAIAAGESLDVIEIDGASNNSVDEVRELKSHITLAPFASKYKVYIIDEVHMLSISAFNALLKTLEEPPAYVVFVLATTEAHKVPVTIRSRCQHIPFHRIGTGDIHARLAAVCAEEKVEYQDEALWELARQADGALRDALSMLEQVVNLGRGVIELSDIEATLGQGSLSSLARWLGSWRQGDMGSFCELDRLLASGASPQRFVEELFSLVRNLWLTNRWRGTLEVLDISDQQKEYLQAEASHWDLRALEGLMAFLAELLPQTRLGLRMDVLSGLLMAKMTHLCDASPEVESKVEIKASPPPKRRERLPDTSVSRTPKAEESSSQNETPGPDIELSKPDPREEPGAAEPGKDETLSVADWSGYRAWQPNDWDAMMDSLFEKDFLIHCALIGALPSTGEKGLLLELPCRYCYEFLKLDRNRMLLKNRAEELCGCSETLVKYGEIWFSCGSAANGEMSQKKTAKEGIDGGYSFDAGEFLSPALLEEIEGAEPVAETKEMRTGGVPFDGLVREVTRWMRGDVILVRRGAEEDDSDDIPLENE